tara:strand:+ start:1299 stop:4190 length:2892 start_codon:yes stop_codon:yes gene_type:complete
MYIVSYRTEVNMERYIDMGFSSTAAAEAVARFDDDLHAGSHWLMTRTSVGQIPKRLCTRQSRHRRLTYYGSVVKLEGLRWTVNKFDQEHALIRIDNTVLARWIHISDGRLEWVVVHHNDQRHTVPTASWTRHVGSFSVPRSVIPSQEVVNMENVVELICKHALYQHSTPICMTMELFGSVFVHCPRRSKPKHISSSDIHSFRVEWMTYFIALCEVHKVEENTFIGTLYNSDSSEVVKLFPPEVQASLHLKIQRWNSPQHFFKQENCKWKQDCLPLVKFECGGMSDHEIHIKVLFHDMTFVPLQTNDVRVYHRFQNLFRAMFDLWGESEATQDESKAVSMDDSFLSRTLKMSSSNHMSAKPSPGFVTKLLPFQKETLGWLLWRETVAPPTSAWGWCRHHMEDGFTFHTSYFGDLSHTAPPHNVRGGVLAQESGMGKTVEMLALIASSTVAGPTLVVMPTAMLSVWMAEARQHVPSLKTIKFHGSRRKMADITSADIVCTTYRIVANDARSRNAVLAPFLWGRIVLDESHEMKGEYSLTHTAVCSLRSDLRWCVSATPWLANKSSVVAASAFLKISSCTEHTVFYSKTITDRNTPLIRRLLTSITWHQEKNKVHMNLPDVTYSTINCENNHACSYQHLLRSISARMRATTTLAPTRQRARQMYYKWWLSVATIHPSLVHISSYATFSDSILYNTKNNTVDSFVQSLGTTKRDISLRELIQSWSDGQENCAICRGVVERPTLTPCSHLFCFDCIQACYQYDQNHKCPMCRTPAGQAHLRELTLQEKAQVDNETWVSTDPVGKSVEMPIETYDQVMQDFATSSSKLETLCKIVQQSSGKTVVFTQYHRVCAYVCEELEKRNISVVAVQGCMTLPQRRESVRSFQEDSNVQVFVMPLKAASHGSTLTAASTVVFVEPDVSPTLRKKAIDWVVRVGQTQPVSVQTLTTTGTLDTDTFEQLVASVRSCTV